MRSVIIPRTLRDFARGASLLLLASVAAGCSSGVSRFTGDDFVTNSIPAQQPVRQQPVSDYVAAPASGGVTRGSLPPVGGSSAAASVANAPIAAPRPVQVASAATARIDPMSSAVERVSDAPKPATAAPRIAATDPAGWSSAGGSQITAKDGETVFNLSRRYGVPANVLMKVNGLDDSGKLQAGQKVLIPTYIYSDRAPVSAPDSNPKVAAAKSSRGEQVLGELPVEQAAAKPATVAKGGTYIVESGDSVLGIARDHGVPAAQLRAANNMTSDSIRIGQKLVIPGAGAKVAAAKPVEKPKANEMQAKAVAAPPAKTAKAETAKPAAIAKESAKPAAVAKAEAAKPKAEPVAYTPPAKKAIETVAAEADDEAPNATGIGKMRWPAKGRVVSAYGAGSGKSRDGIDIAVPEGTSVKSAENGVVIYAGDGLKEFGNTVLVRHDNGLVTVYGHNGALNVKRGQKVKRGEQIATSGMSGSTETPKLHFEVRKDSAPVNPSTFLE